VQNVTWTNAVGLSINGNSLTKTATGDVWNAGASSTQAISAGDGYVEFTASELYAYRMIGLSNGDANQSYQELDFAFYLGMNGYLFIYENGANVNWAGFYSTGDTMRISVESGVVKYKKNGTVVYTSTATPTYPLLVDTSFYTAASTVTNVVISGAGNGSGASGPNVQWLVADHLGTPRMIVDQTGALASVRRHDYLPFGEEIGGPKVGLIGGRTGVMGYGADAVRQKFTGYQFDAETGLNYAQARYQSSVQGRFTSVDPLGASANIGDPQSFNRYSYVQNMPLTAVDPTGMALSDMGVYQTNDPYVADQLYKNSLPRPQQHAKNPPLPKPRPVQIDNKNLPPPPGGPVSTKLPTIDVGPSPPASINVSVTAGPTEPRANTELTSNRFATGVRSLLTVRITDQDNKPLVGWTVEESNVTIESIPNNPMVESTKSATTDSNGTIQDYLAANLNLSNYRLGEEEAKQAVYRQIGQKSHYFGEQTMRIYSPDGGLIAIAVYRRRISNLVNGDAEGALIPPTNSRGNFVNNFRPVQLSPITVTYPKRQP
jgi:RHS repeat-associated protein